MLLGREVVLLSPAGLKADIWDYCHYLKKALSLSVLLSLTDASILKYSPSYNSNFGFCDVSKCVPVALVLFEK